MTESETLKILKDIVSGFVEMGEKRFLHRDLKLANIFMSEGNAVIADFGFAKKHTYSVFYIKKRPWEVKVQRWKSPVHVTWGFEKEHILDKKWYLVDWDYGIWDASWVNSVGVQNWKGIDWQDDQDSSQVQRLIEHIISYKELYQEVSVSWWEEQNVARGFEVVAAWVGYVLEVKQLAYSTVKKAIQQHWEPAQLRPTRSVFTGGKESLFDFELTPEHYEQGEHAPWERFVQEQGKQGFQQGEQQLQRSSVGFPAQKRHLDQQQYFSDWNQYFQVDLQNSIKTQEVRAPSQGLNQSAWYRCAETSEEPEDILLRRGPISEDKAGIVLRREVGIKLLERVEEPINKEVQISGERVLQKVHKWNKNWRLDFEWSVDSGNSETALETEGILDIERNEFIGVDLCVLDGGTGADEEVSAERVLGRGYWP